MGQLHLLLTAWPHSCILGGRGEGPCCAAASWLLARGWGEGVGGVGQLRSLVTMWFVHRGVRAPHVLSSL